MYIELHCHSAYSFVDGASDPAELAGTAAELGYEALALTDHDNVCGAMEFAHACHGVGVRPIVGVELTIDSGAGQRVLSRHRTQPLERQRPSDAPPAGAAAPASATPASPRCCPGTSATSRTRSSSPRTVRYSSAAPGPPPTSCWTSSRRDCRDLEQRADRTPIICRHEFRRCPGSMHVDNHALSIR